MRKNVSLFLIILLSSVVVIITVGAGVIFRLTKNLEEKKEFVVGYIGPLTGDSSALGFSAKKAIELAKKDLAADDFRLVYVDTKCRADEAEKGMQKLIAEGAQAIIGEVCSGATLAAVPYAEKNKIVMISPASTSTELNSISPYFFRTISSDSSQALFAANILMNSGVNEIAIVYSNESYGKSFFDALEKEFEEKGGVVLSSVAIEQEDIYIEDEMKLLMEKKPKVVFIASNSPSSAAAVVTEIKSKEQDIQFFGSEALKMESFLSDAGVDAEGISIISLPENNKNFIRKYKAEFGVEPGIFSSQAYDAFTAIFKAVESGNLSGEEMTKFMKEVDFQGVSGRVRFLEGHDVSANYNVYIVENGNFVKRE